MMWRFCTRTVQARFGHVDNGHAVDAPPANESTADAILGELTVIGTPDRCARQIRCLPEAVGIDHFTRSFRFGDLPQERVLASMRRFAEQVMPAFAPARV
jgi:hypothetical protein